MDTDGGVALTELANGKFFSNGFLLLLVAHTTLSQSLNRVKSRTADGSGNPHRGLWLGTLQVRVESSRRNDLINSGGGVFSIARQQRVGFPDAAKVHPCALESFSAASARSLSQICALMRGGKRKYSQEPDLVASSKWSSKRNERSHVRFPFISLSRQFKQKLSSVPPPRPAQGTRSSGSIWAPQTHAWPSWKAK